MKKLILKLDDIGRDAQHPTFDIIAWALSKKIPLSIGTIGCDLINMPNDVLDIIKLGVKVNLVEIWNHGFRHIRYDQSTIEDARIDLIAGHEAIVNTLQCEPAGFGFPFNKFSDESVAIVRSTFPSYYIYETDYSNYQLLSPEYNSLADGQPRLSYFMERIENLSANTNIIIQAHPPRWTDRGIQEFIQCVEHLTNKHGYVCLNARQAGLLDSGQKVLANQTDSFANMIAKKRILSDFWVESAPKYTETLSNFDSYFLRRFRSDAEKNYIQVSRALYPFKATTILDLGCGLGNWSIPHYFKQDCNKLILNDVNKTIIDALQAGLNGIESAEKVIVDQRNLLDPETQHGYKVDFLVSANTFNYLDPIAFFRFAQSCVNSGGRMLLMVQSGSFNNLRFRNSLNTKDFATASEALSSDFAMLLRRHCSIFLSNVRHVFPLDDIVKLAAMFDFTLVSQFAPIGEQMEEGRCVYECILFKRSTGMKNAILGRQEWLTECIEVMERTFGARAFKEAGFAYQKDQIEQNYDMDLAFPPEMPDQDRLFLQEIKLGIASIRSGKAPQDFKITSSLSQIPDFAVLIDKIHKFASILKQ